MRSCHDVPMATWDDVARVLASFPETSEGTAYGMRAWRVRKKLLVWERPLRKADRAALGAAAPEGDILGLPTGDPLEKDALLQAMPDVFFDIPHFDGHAAVLARLEPLPVDVLSELVEAAWRRHAPKRALRAFESQSSG